MLRMEYSTIGETIDFIIDNRVALKEDVRLDKLLFVFNMGKANRKKGCYRRFVIANIVNRAGVNLDPEDRLILIETILERPVLVEYFCEIN